MVAKRWPTLWVFVGGCLTGAAFIGLHSEDDVRRAPANADAMRRGEELRAGTSKGAVEERAADDHSEAESAAGEPQPTTPAAADAAKRTAATNVDGDEQEGSATETGNSVADLLAGLEAQYRKQGKPAPAAEPEPPPSAPERALPKEAPVEIARSEPQTLGEPGAAKSVSERASAPAAPPAEVAASEARLAALVADAKAVHAALEEAPSRSTREVHDDASFVSGQQQISAQIQQLATLQQVTVSQQFMLLQYLQLLSLPPSARLALLTPSQRRTPGGRIVAGFASSISATDNPWGFDFSPTNLVR